MSRQGGVEGEPRRRRREGSHQNRYPSSYNPEFLGAKPRRLNGATHYVLPLEDLKDFIGKNFSLTPGSLSVPDDLHKKDLVPVQKTPERSQITTKPKRTLSEAQKLVLRTREEIIAEGGKGTIREIADSLGLHPSTVSIHLQRAMSRQTNPPKMTKTKKTI